MPPRIVPGLAAIVLVTLFAPAAARAGAAPGRLDGDPACEIKSANPAAAVEWTRGDKSLAQLVATGSFEIRGSYRMTLCNIGLSVYVLQDARDRRVVYECVSDDTYRAPFPCVRLGTR